MSQESVEAAYRLKLASNPEGELDYQTVEITHPLLSKRYLIVMGTSPLTATLETGETVTFEPSPMGWLWELKSVGALATYIRHKIMQQQPLQLQVLPYLPGKVKLWQTIGGVPCRL